MTSARDSWPCWKFRQSFHRKQQRRRQSSTTLRRIKNETRVAISSLAYMNISRTTKRIVSGLIFAFLLAITLPKLPRAHVGQANATWDTASYAFLGFIIIPHCCWFCGVTMQLLPILDFQFQIRPLPNLLEH